jgi:hypothetical protein
MRHRHRATLRNLLLEFRDHAARAAQHIAKSHRLELRASRGLLQAWHPIPSSRLLAPITLVGLTALSVEINTKRLT